MPTPNQGRLARGKGASARSGPASPSTPSAPRTSSPSSGDPPSPSTGPPGRILRDAFPGGPIRAISYRGPELEAITPHPSLPDVVRLACAGALSTTRSRQERG